MKFRKATKKIVAVASATALASASVFGAANYPSNFVQDGELNAQVVVGSGAASSDMNAAMSIVADLEDRYSEGSSMTTITYREAADGESVSAVDPRSTLNYGETLESVREDLDDTVSDMFEDSDLDNDEYTQELFLLNGEFSYRIFDEVDGEDTAKAGLYYGAFDEFANYTIDFNDNVDITTADDRADLQGQEMIIMGNTFVVESIDEEELTLLGGSNRVALREGDSTTVTVEGVEYEVEAGLISASGAGEVVLTVNGIQKTVTDLDSEEFGNVNVVITDLLSSSRDSQEGYVEFVIGGQKVELTPNGVEINDEDLDDVHPDYDVDVNFLGTNTDNEFQGVTLTYRVDENTVLGAGDSLRDILFDSFELVFDGTNDVDYSTLGISTSSEEVTFDGEMRDDGMIPSEFKFTTSDDSGTEDLYLGSSNKRIFHSGSVNTITEMIDPDRTRGFNFSGTNVNIAVTNTTQDITGNMFYSYVDDDEAYLYEFDNVDREDLEFDFSNVFTGSDVNTVNYDEVQTDLEFANTVFSGASNVTTMDFSQLGNADLELENLLVMSFGTLETDDFDSSSASTLSFAYNQNDIDMDDSANESDSFTLVFNRATDADDAIEMTVGTNDFVSNDETEDNSDMDVYVDHYGTMLMIDTDDRDSVEIMVPSEEVVAQARVVFGNPGSTMSETVSSDMVDDRVAELEADGFTVVSTSEMSTDDVTVNIDGPLTDMDLTEADVAAGNHIVVGGPAVNEAARIYLGIDDYTINQAGVAPNEFVHLYYESANSIVVYGYSAADTTAAVQELNAGTADFEEE